MPLRNTITRWSAALIRIDTGPSGDFSGCQREGFAGLQARIDVVRARRRIDRRQGRRVHDVGRRGLGVDDDDGHAHVRRTEQILGELRGQVDAAVRRRIARAARRRAARRRPR